MTEDSFTYKQAGVDIETADSLKKRIIPLVRATFSPEVLQDIGLFGGMFKLDVSRFREPILVSSVDGVGTKLKIAFMTGRHNTVGIDIVSHCVNDILMQGAEPLFFLDYFATGKLEVSVAEQVVVGLAEGCKKAGCSLIGGETAEMPDFYSPGEYDLAGTIVGVVDRQKIVDGTSVREGDRIIALKSSGLHTNGYSLVRKLFFSSGKYEPDQYIDMLGRTLGEELLEPHRCYAKPILKILDEFEIRGMAHITGGGLTGNIPRILSKTLDAQIELGSWKPQMIFELIRRDGRIEREEMLRTFNMGVGMVLIVPPEEERGVLEGLEQQGEEAWTVGRMQKGSGIVRYRG